MDELTKETIRNLGFIALGIFICLSILWITKEDHEVENIRLKTRIMEMERQYNKLANTITIEQYLRDGIIPKGWGIANNQVIAFIDSGKVKTINWQVKK